MKEIELSRGYVAIIDDADYDMISKHKWHAHVYKSRNGLVEYVYAGTNKPIGTGKRYSIKMHRLIVDAPTGSDVDHIDGNTLNNCRSNLRVCTRQENIRNSRRIRGKSKYKGVCWHKANSKWHAQIKVGNRNISLGTYLDELDAARAYDAAAIKYFGEFACVNTYE